MCEASATASATSSAALLEQDKTQHGALGGLESSRQRKLLLVLGLRAICPDYQPERERERSKQKSADMYIHFVACFAQKSKYNDTPRGASNNLQANILSPITLIRSKVQMQ